MKRDIFDKFMSRPKLRKFYKPYRKYRQTILYIFFGGCTTLVSVGVFALCSLIPGIHELVANILSWFLAVSTAYFTNRTWVFRSRRRGVEASREFFAFYGARLFTLGMEELVLLIFVTVLGLNALAIKIVAQILVLIGNYIVSKWFVFK